MEVGDGITANLFPDETFSFPINNQFMKKFCGSFICTGKLFDTSNFKSEVMTALFLNQMVTTISNSLCTTKKTFLKPLHYFSSIQSDTSSEDTQFHKTIGHISKPFNLHTHSVMMTSSQVTIGCTSRPFDLHLFAVMMESISALVAEPITPPPFVVTATTVLPLGTSFFDHFPQVEAGTILEITQHDFKPMDLFKLYLAVQDKNLEQKATLDMEGGVLTATSHGSSLWDFSHCWSHSSSISTS